jgi:ribosome-binding factor A
MVNQRTLAKLAARIQERAAHCLEFEISDPRAAFITITKVELAHDLSSGKIFYSVLGPRSAKSRAEHMLQSAAGFIQRKVARVLDVRRMPRLSWIYDDSIERAAELDQSIRRALARDETIHAQGHAEESEDEPAWENEYEEFAEEDEPDGAPPPPAK